MSVNLAEMGRSASRVDMAAELTQRFESSAHQTGFQQTLLAEQQMLDGIEATPLSPQENEYLEEYNNSEPEEHDDVSDDGAQDEEAQARDGEQQEAQTQVKDKPKVRNAEVAAALMNAKKGKGQAKNKTKVEKSTQNVNLEGKKLAASKDQKIDEKQNTLVVDSKAVREKTENDPALVKDPKELSDKAFAAAEVVAAKTDANTKVQDKVGKEHAESQVAALASSNKVEVKSQTRASKKLEQNLALKRTNAQENQLQNSGEDKATAPKANVGLSDASADTLTGHTTIDEKMTASMLQKDVAALKAVTPKQKQAEGIVQDITKLQSTGDVKGSAAEKMSAVQRYVLRHVSLTQFGQALASKIASGARQLHIRLDPPELGKLDVDVKLKDGQVYLNVRADSVNAIEAIEGQLNDLRSSLKEQGLDLAGFDVNERQEKGDGQARKGNQAFRPDPEIITLKRRPVARRQRDGLDIVA